MSRIAIFAPSIFTHGGEQRVVTVIANELVKNNEVTIYTCDKKKNSFSQYGLNGEIKTEYYFQYSKKPTKRLMRYIERNKKTIFFEKRPQFYQYMYYSMDAVEKMKDTIEGKFDIVIAISGHLSILLGYAKKMGLSTIAIGWEHNSYEAYFETPNMYLWKREKYFVEATKYLDSCVVLNEDIADKYRNRLGILCDVIYNPRSFESKEKSTLSNKQFVACGRFVEAKGFDLLIEAFEKYSKYEKEWNLLIIGDGPLRNELERLVANKKLNSRITFTGYIDNVKEKMMESSIYLLSSRWEGFPMCVTEAFEVGLPIVCFNIPAVMPLLKNKEGIKVTAFDTSEFAYGMKQLAENTDLREEMAKNAIQMANSLSIENIGNQWKILFEVLERRGK